MYENAHTYSDTFAPILCAGLCVYFPVTQNENGLSSKEPIITYTDKGYTVKLEKQMCNNDTKEVIVVL